MSASPVNDPEQAGVMGCPPGGGGGTGSGEGGGGGAGTGTIAPPAATPFDAGPFLWAACVLGIVGGTFSVEVVGDKFVAWYDAHQALVSARRALNATLQLRRSGYWINPDAVALLELRVEIATERRDDAVGAVEEATGVSILTLIGAGLACGAAAAAPTP